MRGKISVPKDSDIEYAKEQIKQDQKIHQFLEDKTIVKEIFIPGKIFNIVVKQTDQEYHSC